MSASSLCWIRGQIESIRCKRFSQLLQELSISGGGLKKKLRRLSTVGSH